MMKSGCHAMLRKCSGFFRRPECTSALKPSRSHSHELKFCTLSELLIQIHFRSGHIQEAMRLVGSTRNLASSSAELSTPGQAPQELFQELLSGARTITLPPTCCIPYVKIRKMSESGVRRLMHSYLGDIGGNSTITGVTAVGNLPMVVPLVGDKASYPKKYFKENMALTEDEAEAEASKFTSWYGIIEGSHRNEALRRLISQFPEEYLSISWTVLLLSPAPTQKLRIFSRNIIEKQRALYMIASTLYDSIFSLREDYLSLKLLSPDKNITVSALCYYATGSQKTPSETMRVLAKRAISLSDETISRLGELLNSEEPEIAYSRAPKNTPIDSLDCRVFRRVIAPSTFRTSRAFFNNDDPEIQENQASALLRLRSFAKENDYRVCTGAKLDECYVAARKAGKEVSKFNEVLDNDSWPLPLQTMRQNMLHTDMFDSEIALNDGNDDKVLPSLADAYRKVCPAVASMKLAKWTRTVSNSDGSEVRAPPTLLSPIREDPDEDVGEESLSNTISEPSKRRSPDDELQDGCSELAKSNIVVLQMSIAEYAREVLSPMDSGLHDMVLTQPPPSFPFEHVPEVIGVCKNILKPGSTFFTILNWNELLPWFKALRDSEFSVMPHPFVMCHNSSLLQKTRSISMPQQACFFALVAFSPGRRPDGFTPDFSSPYCEVDCSHKRKFAILDNIKPPPHPLVKPFSRSPLEKNERNVKLLCEIMTTFAPEHGSIFDPFGNALATPCAALISGRPCTTLQKNQDVFQIGMRRLLAISKAGESSKKFRSHSQKERVRTRAMFDMYEESRPARQRTTNAPVVDTSDEDNLKPNTSPVTPAATRKVQADIRSPQSENQVDSGAESPDGNENEILETPQKCNVDGCPGYEISISEGGSQGLYGHQCAVCSASVHVLCCQRILRIEVEDNETLLFCTACYTKGM